MLNTSRRLKAILLLGFMYFRMTNEITNVCSQAMMRASGQVTHASWGTWKKRDAMDEKSPTTIQLSCVFAVARSVISMKAGPE
jgi:hypothetical protein